MVIRISKTARRRGALLTELLIAMAILTGALLPIAYSIASERRLARACYCCARQLTGRFDFAALRDAVDAMTARHPILRTSVDFSFQEPVQIVHRRAEVPITVDDVRNLAQDEDKETQISRWLDAELHHRFEWRRAPLFRFHVHIRSNDEFQLTMSDACLDGWSVGTLLTELLAYYFARLDRKAPPELPDPA
jgi:microcystin synthetase protein McyA